MSDDAPTLEFWKNMALGLKDELVRRGDEIDNYLATISAMASEREALQQELAAADELILFVNKSQAWLTAEATIDVVNWSLKAERRKPSGGEAQ